MGLRRRKPTDPRAVVAAATRIPLREPKAAARMAAKQAKWQEEAWAYFDDVGEVKYTTWWLANLVSKVTLYAATIPPDSTDGEPVPVDDPSAGVPPALAAAAIGEVERLRTALGGQAEIQREFVANIEVAGECYLVGWGEREPEIGEDDPTPEEWEIRSISEVKVAGEGKYTVHDGPDDQQGRALDPDRDTIIRIWQRHPRWSAKADSHLRAVLTDCKVLTTLTDQLLAESNSRKNAGVLFMSNEITWGRASETSPGGEGDDEGDDEPFMADLAESLTTPIADPTSAGTVIPLLGRLPLAPGEKVADKVYHLTLGRTTDPAVDARIEARVQRIARGLNAPVEVVMGHQQTTFSNAEQVDEDKFTDHVEPRCLLLVDSLTYAYLHPNLRDAGFDRDLCNRVFVWFDPSDVIGDPDLRPWVELAHRLGLISDEAARRILGFGEDDIPSKEELAGRLAAARGTFDATMTSDLLAMAGISGVEAAPPPPPPALPSGNGAEAPSGNGVEEEEEQAMRVIAALVRAFPDGPPQLPRARNGPHHPRLPQRL